MFVMSSSLVTFLSRYQEPGYPGTDTTSFAVQSAPGTRVAMAQLISIDPAEHHFPCWGDHQGRRRDLAPQPG
jgi:hypothetical protein